ncbi:MAG: hypothetical protein QXR00_01800 [Candidatus Bathyarchaeia archaeon]
MFCLAIKTLMYEALELRLVIANPYVNEITPSMETKSIRYVTGIANAFLEVMDLPTVIIETHLVSSNFMFTII